MPHVIANGVRLHYELSGTGNRPVVVFSNSLGTTLHMWDEVAEEVAKGHRVLRFDTRGHGGSQTMHAPASIDDLANDLAGLLDALAIPEVHMVGLSLGGMTGQCLAARDPARVLTLTLMATSAFLPNGGWTERAARARQDGMTAIEDLILTRWFTPAFAPRAPARLAQVREELRAIDPEGYARACETIRDMDLRARLSQITCPTLIMAGHDDEATPVAHSQEIAAGIAQASLVVLEPAAHLLAVEQPEAASRALLAFLAQYR